MSQPESDYLVRGSDGRDYPANLLSLRAWAAEGRLTAEQRIFDTTRNCWSLARDIDELKVLLPTSPAELQPRNPSKRSSQGQFFVGIVFGVIAVALLCIAMIGRSFASRSSSSAAAIVASSPQEYVSAESLFTDYQSNEAAADARFRGRRIRVTGIVETVSKGLFDETIVKYRTSNAYMSVQAEIRRNEAPGAVWVRPGQQLSLICRGKGMVIGSPILDDCTFQ